MSEQSRGIKCNARSLKALLAVFIFGASGSLASAQNGPEIAPVENSSTKKVFTPSLQVGDATHRLLEIQARGTLASDRLYPVPVAVAEKIYQRYLDSFAHPIPEKSGSALEKLE